MTLPDLIPIFPLPNAVLFPGVPLPLHIFEPRYRTMVRDVRDGEDALIGVVLLRGDWQNEYYANPDVYRTGCAGRVVRIDELTDGRFNIILQGQREFEIQREELARPYRQAHACWRSPANGLQEPELRSRLLALAGRFVGDCEPRPALNLLRDTSTSDELFVNLLCSALNFSPLEMQALLEAPSLAQRAARLCEVLQFALEAGGLGAAGSNLHH